MKKITKIGKIFLLIATVFSYISSPVAVLAEEISTSGLKPLVLSLTSSEDEDGELEYLLYYISADPSDYENTKTYTIELETTVTYANGDVQTLSEINESVNGEILNSVRSSYELNNPVSEYYNGKYVLDVTVYDSDTIVYSEELEYATVSNVQAGLTGKLNGEISPNEEVVNTTTVGNYNVTEGEYTQELNILPGELSPTRMYRIVYTENDETTYSDVITGEELRSMTFDGSTTDLTGKLAGTYSYTDTVVIEEVALNENEEYEVINTYTYYYNANLVYNDDNDELFSNMYGVTFEDGYMYVNAKGLNDTDKVITLGELVNGLEDTITLEVLDEESNILDLTNEEVLASEVMNGYTINFTSGVTASYVVIVKGDATSDNEFTSDDLEGVINGYLNEENMPSMDMITLEEETSEEESEDTVYEEFGTLTFEDVMVTNELLKEDSNTEKEEPYNTDLSLSFGDVISSESEICVGDTIEVDVLINSSNTDDYIDGIDSIISTSDNLKLTDVKFSDLFTGIYNEDGRLVAAGTPLVDGNTAMTLVFCVIADGTASIEFSGNTSKYLTISEFDTITKEITITRRSSVNNLSSLNASVGTFDVEFDKDVTVYTLTVPYDTESVILSGGLEDVNSEVDGLIRYELTDTKTTAIVTVTAEDGSVKTYTIYIIKDNAPVSSEGTEQSYVQSITYYQKSSNNYLKSLEVDGYEIEFNKDVYEYNITVKSSVTSLDIKSVAEDLGARVEITGNENFKEGENTVVITVTAEDGTTKEYKLIVNKEEESKNPIVKTEDSSNTAEKVIIIVLIILVVIGLLYLIFKKDEEEEEIVINSTKKEQSKSNNKKNTNSSNKNNNKKN